MYWTDRQASRQTGKQTDRQTYRQTDRHADRQTDRQTDLRMDGLRDRDLWTQQSTFVEKQVCSSVSLHAVFAGLPEIHKIWMAILFSVDNFMPKDIPA